MTRVQEHTEWKAENPLRKWRMKNDVSRLGFASQAGFHPMTILRWEDGTSNPGWTNLAEVARIMGVDIAELAREWDEWRRERP